MTDVRQKLEAIDEARQELLALLLREEGLELGDSLILPRPRHLDSYPLTPTQRGLWLVDRLEGGSSAYNIGVAFRLRGIFAVAAFDEAIGEIIHRHESLRTVFLERDGQPVQKPLDSWVFRTLFVDNANVAAARAEAMVEKTVRRDHERPFDLETGPLLRVTILRLDKSQWVLSVVLHHIIADAWSFAVLVSEMEALYRANVLGVSAHLPTLPVQFGDYAVWLQKTRGADKIRGALRFWKNRLEGAPALLELPLDFPRPARQSFRGSIHTFEIPSGLTLRFHRLSRRHEATFFMSFQTVCLLLLAHYSGQQDISIGSTLTNRQRAELEPMMGYLSDTVVFRNQVDGEPSFSRLVQRVRVTTLAVFSHQNVSLEQILEAVKPVRSPAYSPLFQVMLEIQNAPVGAFRLPGLQPAKISWPSDISRFDLSFGILDHGAGLRVEIEYCRDLFRIETVRRMGRHVRNLLRAAVEDPAAKLTAVSLLDDSERHQLLWEWNATPAGGFESRGLPGLHCAFKRAAAQGPDRIALVYRQTHVSYDGLDDWAGGLAATLRDFAVGPEHLVGVVSGRTPAMAAGILGILKSGAAFLPLDPINPPVRLQHMVDAAKPSILLVEKAFSGKVSWCSRPKLPLEPPRQPGGDTASYPEVDISGGQHAAYAVFTSGSTGLPKGALLSHRALAAYCRLAAEAFSLTPEDRFLQFAPLGFDVLVEEMFPTWSRQGAVVIPGGETDSFAEFGVFLAERLITTMELPGAYWRYWLDELLEKKQRPARSLRLLIVGCETVPGAAYADWKRFGIPLLSIFGLSETSITSCYHPAGLGDGVEGKNLPIGRPLANTRLHLLDRYGDPVPMGILAELFVGGEGLGRGYLHHPALTAASFVPDANSARSGARLYKTGDRARYRTDGAIQFLGRLDSQIKIRGFRIEPGEIETILLATGTVSQAVAAVSPGKNPALAAFVVPRETKPIRESLMALLQSRCRQALPEYMVPSTIVMLDQVPLAPNGKIDRARLPFPSPRASNRSNEDLQDPFEIRLARIWQEVLRAETIKARDHFFELGGHSLTAMQLLSRIRGEFDVSLKLIEIFETPTLRGQAAKLKRARRVKVTKPLRPIVRKEGLPLSYAQQRLWFLDQLEGPGPTYNVPLTLKLEGPLGIDPLERAYGDLVARHEGLRTVFPSQDGQPKQRVLNTTPTSLPVIDLSGLAPCPDLVRSLAGKEMRRSFDLSRGPLSRTVLTRVNPRIHVLQVTVHHIIADGWSMDLLVEDWVEAYGQRCLRRAPEWTPLAVQYADFAVWQREQSFEDDLAFWEQHLAGAPTRLGLPTDRPRPAVQSFRGASIPFPIEERHAKALDGLARTEEATLFMGLQTVFLTLLYRYSHQEDILVGSAVAGRNRPEIEPLVGFFVNPLVFRNDLSGEPGFAALLNRVRLVALAAFEHQDLPFEQIADHLGLMRDRSRSPLFQAMFDLQNMAAPSSSLPLLDLKLLTVPSGVAKFDLTLTVMVAGGTFSGSLEYNTDLFDRETAHRMIVHFQNLLKNAVADPAIPIDRLPMLGIRERNRILKRWSVSENLPYALASVPALLAIQMAKTPDAVAVETSGHDPYFPNGLTFRQLDDVADRFGALLREQGVGLETPVGICLPRNVGMMIALIGIWKAGATQVPLDPDNPWERMSYMIGDSGLMNLVCDRETLERLPAFESSFLNLLTLDMLETGGPKPEPPCEKVVGDHLAYLMYTSGSTGVPKGVAVPHRGLANYIQWCSNAYLHSAGRGAPVFGSLGFDATLTSVWAPLIRGLTVTLVQESQPWMALATTFNAEPPYHMVKTTPSLLATLENMPARDGNGPTIPVMVLGGEALLPTSLEAWLAKAPGCRVFNEYGPTETVVGCCVHEAHSPSSSPFGVPIGRPIVNTEIYLLDRALNLVPRAVDGEILIGGAGLARGYQNRPDLTANRFIPNLFTGIGTRLYRSGDLARYLPDGRLVYLGRRDQQIQFHGIRIEPGEIEASLESHPRVARAVVLPIKNESNGVSLTAFIQSKTPSRPHSSELDELPIWRDYLRHKLPDPMLPARFITVEAWPVTRHGKLDRPCLEKQAVAGHSERPATRKPTHWLEKEVAGIWEDLLNLSEIGADEDFFELGGHSLLAVQVMSRVRDLFSVELSIADLFDAPTVAALSKRIETLLGAQATPESISPTPRRGRLPLSYSQQRLWFLDRLEGRLDAYNIPFFLRLEGFLDVARLHDSFTAMAGRHEILRTTFKEVEGAPNQVIHKALSPQMPLIDLQMPPGSNSGPLVEDLVAREAGFRFNLAEGPLCRFSLCRLAHQNHALFLNLHHTIADGWSIPILVKELISAYQSALGIPAPPVPVLPIQYADYAVWQRHRLSGDRGEAQLRYWREKLQRAPVRHEIPTDRPRPPQQSFRGATHVFPMETELGHGVARLGRGMGASPFMTYQALFAALLCRYSRQDEIMIGTPVANRDRLETEHLIGCFVNTLVLRNDLSGDPGFVKLLGRTRELALEAYAHQEVPFERVVDRLQPERGLNYTPLFQIMFLFEPRSLQDPITLPGLSLAPVANPEESAQFDLKLHMEETTEGPRGYLNYQTDLYNAATMERFAGHFRMMAQAVVDDPHLPLSRVALVTTAERRRMLGIWNHTRVSLQGPKIIHALVEAQSNRTADTVAVSCGNRFWSYRHLDRQANALARELATHGAGPESVAAICMERSNEMVAGLLGILKAGAAYLPLDPELPAKRRRYMVENAGAGVLVSRQDLVSEIGAMGLPLVLADRPRPTNAVAGLILGPDQMAYVIYTSGSTGRPKGVMNSHRGVCNRLLWMHERFPLHDRDVVLQKTPYGFDVSVWEFFWPLISGARLEMALPGGHRDPAYLQRILPERGITQVHFVPAMLRAFLHEYGQQPSTGLKRVFCSGEALTQDLLAAYFRIFSAELHNLYGPTEAAVEVSHHGCGLHDLQNRVPIGKPIANTQIYLLDRTMRFAPLGVTGELFIGGIQVARGYRSQPELTAEAFVPVPLELENGVAGGRLYRTGDLARYRDDGSLDYLGRSDHQIKVRGFRIEPGEIETVLLSSPRIIASAVKVKDQAIYAYVVPGGSPDPSGEVITHLREHVSRILPHYMLPSAYLCLAALPLTPSGKVDRKALPMPAPAESADCRQPITPTEHILARIWESLLSVSPGIGDNFFELGGHSLLGTRLVTRIRAVFKVDLPLRALFTMPILGPLAAEIDRAKRQGKGLMTAEIVPVSRKTRLPLSFAQERLWFLDRLQPGSAAYNIPVGLWLTGGMDVTALERAVASVLSEHESLRTQVGIEDGTPFQEILDHPQLPLELVDLKGLDLGSASNLVRDLRQWEGWTPFDLTRFPLLRIKLLRTAGNRHALFITLHHLIADGWSMGLLVQALCAHYRIAAGVSTQTEPFGTPRGPTLQFADYACWQRRLIEGDQGARQARFWQRTLAGAPAQLNLSSDQTRPETRSTQGASLPFHLSAGPLARFQRLCGQQAVTLFMGLHAITVSLLYRYSGQTDIVIGTPVANRNHDGVESLIGCFVNTLALRCNFSSIHQKPEAITFRALLDGCREIALNAFANQDLPFERVVESVLPLRSSERTPLFQVMLVLQNLPAAPVDLPELSISAMDEASKEAMFDLSLVFEEPGDSLRGTLEYATDLFHRTSACRFIHHLLNLMCQAASHPDLPLSQLEIRSPAERQQSLVQWNDTRAPTPRVMDVLPFLAARFQAAPDSIALEAGCLNKARQFLSSGFLGHRTDRWSGHLRQTGVGPESLVGLLLGRGPTLVTAMVAVLKCGAAFVPIDPSYPQARVEAINRDCGPALMLTQEPARHELFTPMMDVDQAFSEPRSAPAAMAPPPQTAAYMIYTSGSSGLPKGVSISRGALAHLALTTTAVYGLRNGDRMLQFASPGFDTVIDEVFCSLPRGITLIHRPVRMIHSSDYFWKHCRALQLTILDLPTAMWHQLATDLVAEFQIPTSVRLIITGGEQVQAEKIRHWNGILRVGPRLLDTYGPTEAAVIASSHEGACFPAETDGSTIPIGRPLANTRLYVMDDQLIPRPIGLPGELCIAGDGLARGYHRRPRTTAVGFVPNPLTPTLDNRHGAGRRLYRTGDRARLLADGRMAFLGRVDRQVKIRGFRVELEEIAAVLRKQPGIADAVALCRPVRNGDARLVAYLVPSHVARAAKPLSERSLRIQIQDRLSRSLPVYMIPSEWVFLPRFPLTPNHKIDLGALPEPNPGAATAGAPVSPRNEIESRVMNIWLAALGRKTIGIFENFFDIGGHSLAAMRIAARVKEAFGVELPLRTLFEAPTVSAFAGALERALKGSTHRGSAPLEPRPPEANPPLSFAQQRLWFLYQLGGPDPVYNIPTPLEFSGPLDCSVLGKAVAIATQRHESLRTVFHSIDGRPYQHIHARIQIPWTLIDFGGLQPGERATAGESLARREAGRPFHLEKGPLLRLNLIRGAIDTHWFLLTMHHIVTDGWSMDLLVRELAALYVAFLLGEDVPLEPPRFQYADYAHWQRRVFAGQHLERQLAYWDRQLKAGPHLIDLPLDNPRPAHQTHEGESVAFSLSPPLSQSLEAHVRDHGVTPFILFQSAFAILMRRYSGQNVVVLGTPVANRIRSEVESVIGFFVNTLVLRHELTDADHLGPLLQKARNTVLGAFDHQEAPFEQVVERIQPERNLSHSPLFQVFFTWQEAVATRAELPGIGIRMLGLAGPSAKFDLSLTMSATDQGYAGALTFNRRLFRRETIVRMSEYLVHLLAEMACHGDKPVFQWSLINGGHRRKLLTQWQDSTPSSFPVQALPHLLSIRMDDDRDGVIGAKTRLTRGALEKRVRSLSQGLRTRGMGAETTVAFLAERTVETVICMLAIIRGGGAFVPLDSSWPPSRLNRVYRDSGAVLVLSSGSGTTPTGPLEPLRIDEVMEDGPACRMEDVDRARLAYLVYTSGSTGGPKGVAVSHGALANYIAGILGLLRPRPEDSFGLVSSPAADLGFTATFPALCCGARLHILDKQTVSDPLHFSDYLARHPIDFLKMVPSHLAALLTADTSSGPFPRKCLILGGEPAANRWIRSFHNPQAGFQVMNHYGPTEATVGMLTHVHGESAIACRNMPLANVLPRTTAYILDHGLAPVPVGISGELFIGGSGLARNYWQRPGLTAGSFIPNPFTGPGSRLYKTGDRVRILADQATDLFIEFLGRMDEQVKIRGFRVEPGEIVVALTSFSDIDQAAVIAQTVSGEPRLVAYVTPNLSEPSRLRLADFLKTQLPGYMIPAEIISLEALPLNANGKLDRHQLIRMTQNGRPGIGTESTAPSTPTEKQLARIWGDVLGRSGHGAMDNFFDVGGHSLAAVRVITQINRNMNLQLNVVKMFEKPTISAMAKHLEALKIATASQKAPRPSQGRRLRGSL